MTQGNTSRLVLGANIWICIIVVAFLALRVVNSTTGRHLLELLPP